ncbi:MAG: beta-galactosidase trimerization domain-containing protein [Candidatus Devosia euplotis]|nr:beta-galactosidase trimerization domain-containing protein [Candidatus Devosia euplotis]
MQLDEQNARLYPEWRVRSATENRFDPGQMQAGWHTLCLNHKAYRDELLAQAREVASAYDTPGIFFDIVLTPDCVCQECLDAMAAQGLDPASPEHRLQKDEWVNEVFRSEMSAALNAEFPGMRIFYNCGHIHKQGPKRFAPHSCLELESLPTGGWGYNHFPSSARYATTLGLDFVAHTGKFHTSWGEFGGFKHPGELEYEAAQMVALGSKCLVGDQLHPNGAINLDTYASIGLAYARVENLEPFLEDARQVSEAAILSAEYFHTIGARNNHADDGAAQMLQELKRPFDVIDPSADFAAYRVIILPDEIPVEGEIAQRLNAFVTAGGKLLLSGTSAMDADGRLAVPAGIRSTGKVAFDPSYLQADAALDVRMTTSPLRGLWRSANHRQRRRIRSGRRGAILFQPDLSAFFVASARPR